MWLVYILKNDISGKFYIGSTKDIEKRLIEHNRGRKEKWCGRQKGQWIVVYKKECESLQQARVEENKIKKQKSCSYIEKLVYKYSNGVVD